MLPLYVAVFLDATAIFGVVIVAEMCNATVVAEIYGATVVAGMHGYHHCH